MLSKARERGVDWAKFLPLALYSIRQIAHSATGYSPHELVFGRRVTGALDLLYAGWTEDLYSDIEVSEWVVQLKDRLSVLENCSFLNELGVVEKRTESFNRNKSDRFLVVGDLILLRTPGIQSALQAAWEGPFRVTEVISRVTYKVHWVGGEHTRIVHLNNTKTYRERKACSSAVVAEENSEMAKWDNRQTLSVEKCDNYKVEDLQRVLAKLSGYFSNAPGLCLVGECQIVVEEGSQIVKILPRSIPVHIRDLVKKELDKMLAAGIIELSDSVWSSPVVPVRKKNGSIRVCIDFREVNSITPLRRFWLPSLREILDRVSISSVLSNLDLTSGSTRSGCQKILRRRQLLITLSASSSTRACHLG